MKLKYWNSLETLEDNNNPFASIFKYDNGDIFYVEPVFYTKLVNMIAQHTDEEERILQEMERVVHVNHKVVFVGTYEFPQCEVDDDFVFLEIEDITNRLQIFVEDKSRGSDYGD